MKILSITPYVTIAGRPEFERNKTGFGYMVYDIAKAVGVTEHVDVLATDSRGDAFDIEGVHYLSRTVWLILFNCWHTLSILKLIKILNQYKMTKGNATRMVYYWLLTGYLKNVLCKRHYDLVHIHGMKFPTAFWIQVCRNCNIPVVLTSHGLNSFSDTVKMEPEEKRYERDLLKRIIDGELTMTVISTGMKLLIEKTYGVDNNKNIHVVCNSFTFADNKVMVPELDIRSKFGIDISDKVIVCVGNVCVRKNQGQLISAFALLPKEIAEHTHILFLGGNLKPDYTIETLSIDSVWKDHFVVCGAVPKEQVRFYYEQSDGVALISLSEGFGLSLIEGMHFGKPCMTFTDVDAYEDIYHPEAVIGVEEHSDEAVAKGIEQLLIRDWNEEHIKEYSKKFESQTMAENYLTVYKNVIVK